MGLLERDVRAGDISVIDGGTVEVRVVVSNLLVVLECLGAVMVLVKSKKDWRSNSRSGLVGRRHSCRAQRRATSVTWEERTGSTWSVSRRTTVPPYLTHPLVRRRDIHRVVSNQSGRCLPQSVAVWGTTTHKQFAKTDVTS